MSGSVCLPDPIENGASSRFGPIARRGQIRTQEVTAARSRFEILVLETGLAEGELLALILLPFEMPIASRCRGISA